MDWIFLGFVIFLFILAISDLWVGVSNDAVNFLNSAIGSKAAKFRTIITVAAIGVFCGAIMSNGMMDIARHGIFRPEQYCFQELMYIFLAVMVTGHHPAGCVQLAGYADVHNGIHGVPNCSEPLSRWRCSSWQGLTTVRASPII